MEWRLAARHTDRRHRPQLPRAIDGVEVRLPARRGSARRAAGRNERLQSPTAAMGEGTRAGRDEADASSVEASATYFPAEGRIVLSALRQLRGDAADRFERFAHPSPDRALQSGAVPDAAARRAADDLCYVFSHQLLRRCDTLSLSEREVAVLADPSGYGDGHRACLFKYARRAGGPVQSPIRLRAKAEGTTG